MERECAVYRKILLGIIDNKIKELQKPMMDYDCPNWNLKRASMDGAINGLSKIRRIIND